MRRREKRRTSGSRIATAATFTLETMEARWLMSTTIAAWSFTNKESVSTALISPSDGTAGVSVTNGQTVGTPSLTAIGMTYNGTTDSEDITSTSGTADASFSEYLWRVRGAGTGTDGDTNGWNQTAPEYNQGAEIDLNTTDYSHLNLLTFDWYSTTSGVKDLMVQYNLDTTNSTGWTNVLSTPLVATSNDYYGGAGSSPTTTVDLSGISGAANDPNFGIRLVSAYDPNFGSGYSAANSADSGTQTLISNTGGNWRFDNITVTGTLNGALAPTITMDPASQTVTAGTQVTLTAAASGNPTPTVQWQISTDGGSTFSNILDATSTSYTFTATEGMIGDEFQAVFTNATSSATTNPAIITVAGTPISQWFFSSGVAPTAGGSTALGTGNNPYASLQGSSTDGVQIIGLQNDYASVESYPESDIINLRSGVNPSYASWMWRVRGGGGGAPTGQPGVPDGWSQNAPEYTQGVVWAINTTGYSNITLQFDWYSSGIADYQPQYSPDGGSTWINAGSIITATGNDYYGISPSGDPTGVTVDLQGITAANNNPNFQLRLVAAYDPNLPMITDGNELDPTVHGQYASAGFGPANAEQVITLGSTNNFTLTFNGQTTDTISYDGTPGTNFNYANMASNIASALAPLSNIGAGNVTVVAADQTGERFLVTFTGGLADTAEPNMTSSDSNATVQTWVNGTNSSDGVTRYVDGGGSFEIGNITFNGDKISGAPGITVQPLSETVTGGSDASFTATAYTELAPMTVQWEVSTDDGSSYQPIVGATELDGSTSTYTFTTNADLSESGNLYEAVFTNSGGSTATAPAKLTVVAAIAPVVTTQPHDTSVQAGNVAIFTADASGSPIPSIQWQINNGSGWNDLTDGPNVFGSDTDTLQYTTNIDGSENGDQFRAVFTNLVDSATSNPATMTVLAAETTITNWDFNQYSQVYNNSPAPTGGVVDVGTASAVGMTLPFNPNDPATGTDGYGSVAADDITDTAGTLNPNFDENTWRIRGGVDATDGGEPANGWSNFAPEYSQGVQFSVPTTGFKDVYVTMDWYTTKSGILDAQEQYTLDGTNWINIGPQIEAVSNDYYGATATGAPVPLVIDVSAIDGAANNPNFGIRLVSAYNPTLGDEYANAALVGDPAEPVQYNGAKGNWRFANIVFHGDPISPVTVLNGQVATSPSQSISFQFSSDVSASLSTSNLQLTPLVQGSATSASSVSFDTSTNTATFDLSPDLSSGIYQATLSATGIHDGDGGYMAGNYTFDFLFVNDSDTLTLPAGSQIFTVQQLLMGSNATLDIGNNIVVDQYTGASPADSITSEIAAGYNNAQWNGIGITSSAAASDSTHATGVGSFDSGSQITIARTWNGDANLDGVVNSDDVSLMILGQTHHETRWQDGDFSYHGQVNADDWMKLLYAVAYSKGQSLGNSFNAEAVIQASDTGALATASTAGSVLPAFAQTPVYQNSDLTDLLDSPQSVLG